MGNLIINGTKVSPEVVFYADGRLKIAGKIITENAVITFEPIFRWFNSFEGNKIVFDIDLEYMNTSASMQLYSFLTQLDESETIESIHVNWYFDEDDEEHLETGEFFSERLERVEFRYIKTGESREVA